MAQPEGVMGLMGSYHAIARPPMRPLPFPVETAASMTMRGLQAAAAASPRGVEGAFGPCSISARGATAGRPFSAVLPRTRDAVDGGVAATEGRLWRRVWSSVHLPAVAGAPNASAGAPPPSPSPLQNPPCEHAACPLCVADSCPLHCAPQASTQPFPPHPQSPHRCSCPRCSGSRCFADREPALRRHAPWSAEDARSQSPSACRRRPGPYWCNCTGHVRRPAPWQEVPHSTDMCPTYLRPARYDRPNGAWDDAGEPPWELRSYPEYERRRAEFQLWNPERTCGVPHRYDEETHSPRWDHASRTLVRCQTGGRIETESRRRPSGDVGYCPSEWDPVHVRRNTREYPLWDGLERGISSSDGRDARNSVGNNGEYLVGRSLLQRYSVERENEEHRDNARRTRYGSFAVFSQMAGTQNALPAALGSSETIERVPTETDILPIVSPLRTRNCFLEPSQENHMLLAPPANFSAGSNEDSNDSDKDSNEPQRRQLAKSDNGVRRPNSADTPENQESMPKYADLQVECRARVLRFTETTEEGTPGGENNIRSSTPETSQVRTDDRLLDNILRSSKIENTSKLAAHAVAKSAISRGVNTVLEDLSENESMVESEQVHESSNILELDDKIEIKECLPPQSFESAWNVIEQSNILQNSIENQNRNANTEIQESTSCQIGTTRFIAPSQVPDIVDAAWKVIELSDIYKTDSEKRTPSHIESENIRNSQSRDVHDSTPGRCEHARNVTESSKILNCDTMIQFDRGDLRRDVNATRKYKSSTDKHNQESLTTQRQLSKSARSRADSLRLQPKLLSAAWNVVKTSSAFKDELERLRRLSNVSPKEGSVTTETSSPTPSKPHEPREHRERESPDLFQQDREEKIMKQESEDSQVQSLYGERTVLSVKDGTETFQMVDEGGKLDECKNLPGRYEKNPDGFGGHGIQLVGRKKSRDRSNLTDYRASTSMQKEIIHENHTKKEQISTDSCGTVRKKATRKHEFTNDNEEYYYDNNSGLSNAPDSPRAASSCLQIWCKPGCSKYSEDMLSSQEEKKKMHFRISRRQDVSSGRRLNNGTSSDFPRCSDKDVAERKRTHTLSGESYPTTRFTSHCRSSLREDITTISEESNIYSGDISPLVLPSTSFSNNIGRRVIFPIASELCRNKTYPKNDTPNVDVRTIGSIDFKNELPTMKEVNRNENKKILVAAADWQNTGVQTDVQNVRRIDSDHLNKCIQANESVTSFSLDHKLISRSMGDAFDRDKSSSGRSSENVQKDAINAVKKRNENEEIKRRSRCIQIATKTLLR